MHAMTIDRVVLVFRMFLCRQLDYGERWHVDQFSIDCTGYTHQMFQRFAILGIMIYPIG